MTGLDSDGWLREQLDVAQRTQETQLNLLERLVNIDSGTGQPGVTAVLNILRSEWETLGFTCQAIPRPEQPSPTLVMRCRAADPRLRILLLGHADTVFDEGTAQARPFKRHDGRIFGPGVADMKGGLVAMLGAMSLLRRTGTLSQLDVTVLHNTDEETGSRQSRATIEELARDRDLVCVFEPGRPSGALVVARRGTLRYRLDVEGVAAHSGVNPQDGASAVEEIARKIVALQALNGVRSDLSVNVGTVQGGSRVNIVPDHATALIDVRMSESETAEHARSEIERITRTCSVPRTSARIELLADRPPLSRSTRQGAFADCYLAAGEALGLDLELVATGGASDGNFTGALGVPTIDALGPVGDGYHTDQEFFREETLATRTALTAAALRLATESGLRQTAVISEPA